MMKMRRFNRMRNSNGPWFQSIRLIKIPMDYKNNFQKPARVNRNKKT